MYAVGLRVRRRNYCHEGQTCWNGVDGSKGGLQPPDHGLRVIETHNKLRCSDRGPASAVKLAEQLIMSSCCDKTTMAAVIDPAVGSASIGTRAPELSVSRAAVEMSCDDSGLHCVQFEAYSS